MPDNVFVKNSSKDNDVRNVNRDITTWITTILKDVKVGHGRGSDRSALPSIRLACDCHPYGIIDKQCDMSTGMCQCKANVIGQRCDQCQVETIRDAAPMRSPI